MSIKIRLGRTYLYALLVTGIIALVSCAPAGPRWQIGLHAVSPNGEWASVVEHTGDPLTWQLARLDLRRGESKVLARGIAPDTAGSISPDGRFVLARTPDGWSSIDVTTGRQIAVTGKDESVESVQFLPNGDLLILSNAKDGTRSFVVAKSASPRDASLRVDRVQYSFSAQTLRTAVLPLSGFLPLFGLTDRIQDCAQRSSPQRVRWLLVDAYDKVSILNVSPDGPPSLQGLTTKQSYNVTALLRRQVDIVATRMAPPKDGTKAALTPGSIPASPTAISPETIRGYAGQMSLGSFSPSTSKNELLLMLAEIAEGDKWLFFFSLYLIDLDTGAEPQLLSSRSEWIPSFAFSPDGRQILYEKNLDGVRSLHIANSDGTSPRRVVGQNVAGICWY